MFLKTCLLCFFPIVVLFAGCQSTETTYDGWPVAGNTGNTHYSSLTQIDSSNVQQLQVAWTFHTGDIDTGKRSEIQCNPVVVDGIMYITSPNLQLLAIDAATGVKKWAFNPLKAGEATHVNRGVVYWSKGNDKRILYTAASRLYAVNALTGQLVAGFGDKGSTDLREGLDSDKKAGYVIATSPGIVFNDLLVLGSRVSETSDAAPGHIRAYNVLTGKREWIFHTIPHPGEFGYDTWPADAWKTMGGVNSWSGMTLDPETGLVYVPLGSPSFDFYGGDRKGVNLFGNSLVALDVMTGKRIWHFQAVHHDLWDRDLPAAPTLVTVNRGGKNIKAVAQISKQGFVFLFNRATGEPLFPIAEQPVPASSLNGELTWATQPFPVKPAPFVRQHFTEDQVTDLSPASTQAVKQRWEKLESANLFSPPSKQGTIILPGFDGGGEWGGAGYDPETSTLYVNASEMPWILTMVDAQVKNKQLTRGEQVYQAACATCHGLDRTGAQHLFPSLIGIGSRMDDKAIHALLLSGRGRMPSYAHLSQDDRDMVTAFITGSKNQGPATETAASDAGNTLPYIHTGYHRFTDSLGYPAIKPPWGVLVAINLNTGEQSWNVRLGEYPELTAKGIP
ncbi:MAG: c-type cytochrome, partial [Chitinophagaceae bacterium]